MAVKLADTLAPMGDFEIAEAKDISVNIGGTKKMLQKAIEDGDIGGSSDIVVKCTEDQYGALLPEQKALNIIYCTEKNLYYHDETIVPVVDTTPITDSIGSLESLKTTEKTNLVGAINEVSDSLVDYYSTTATKTNKVWFDGKPIYRQVIQTNTPTEADKTTVVASLENTANDITRIDGFIMVGSGSQKGYIPINGAVINDTTFKGAWCSAKEIYMSVSEYYINRQAILIVEYTKS